MKTIDKIKNNKKIKDICKEYGVSLLAIFGSVARGGETDKSDIDLLVDFSGKRNLFKLIELSNILTDIFGKKTDIITRDSLNADIRDNIIKDMVIIYGS